MDTVKFSRFKSQTMSMLNLLEDAGNKYSEGSAERVAAYSEIAVSLGQPSDTFALMA